MAAQAAARSVYLARGEAAAQSPSATLAVSVRSLLALDVEPG